MHQHVVSHHPDDVNWDNAFVDKPFYHWLSDNPYTYYHTALYYYLGDGTKDSIRGGFTSEQVKVYKYTHEFYWREKLKN